MQQRKIEALFSINMLLNPEHSTPKTIAALKVDIQSILFFMYYDNTEVITHFYILSDV